VAEDDVDVVVLRQPNNLSTDAAVGNDHRIDIAGAALCSVSTTWLQM
jgi:hypothetical protein